jgi:ligand-binding sensor domain-containing protein
LAASTKYILFVILLLTRPSNIIAQPFPELRFQSLSDKDGLSNNIVNVIAQDTNGFMWFGTNNGLNRFDGYRFKQFFHDEKDPTSLTDNLIAYIVPDKKSNLWISTSQGVSYFNTITQQCTNFVHNPNDSASIRNDEHPFIYPDSSGNTWLTSYGGLYKIDKDLHYSEEMEGVAEFQFYQYYDRYYYSIIPDKKGQLWSSAGNRLYVLDAVTKKVKKTFIFPQEKSIAGIYFDSNNRMWVKIYGTGLFEFIEATNKWQYIDFKGVSVAPYWSVIEWTVDNKKYLAVGTNDIALVLLDPQTMKYKVYRKNAINKNYIISSYTQSLFVDRQNILWVATADGVSYVTPSSRLLDIIAVSPPVENTNETAPSPANVNSFLPDESGNWVSTWHWGGIYRFDKNWKLKKYMPNFLCSKRIQQGNYNSSAYFFHRYRNEMYCTTDSGMFAIDTGNYRTRLFYPDDIKTFPVDLRNIIPVSEKLWWIRSLKYGIYVFDIVEKKFVKHYQYKEGCINCLPQAWLRWLLQTPDGTMYATSEDGLYEYRPATDDFVGYKRNEKDPLTFPANDLFGAALDKMGKLWIGTSKGICVFNTFTKKVEKTFVENKIMGRVSRVCIDDFQNVWFSNTDGTWCWLRSKDKLIHFSNTEDMPTNNGGGVLVNGNDGSIYSGCSDGILKFYPKKLMDDSAALLIPVAITEVTVNDSIAPYIINTKNEKSIEMQSFQNSFAVDFAVLNYDGVKDNLYYYRLMPSNKIWLQNSNGHLSFNNLPPGTYRLEVKGGNKITGDFEGFDFLIITVQPHWWQSWWCKLIFILVAAGVVTYFVKRRIKMIRKEGAVKQKIAAIEMQALRAQMNPHFIFNSLNSIENFMMKNEKRIAIDYLGKFALLIRMILDSSRNELVPFTKDLEAMKLYVELEQFRYKNKFAVTFTIDPILLNSDYRVPPLLIQPFVENAIAHGLSKSRKNNLQLLVAATFEDDYILFTIQDNGIGRAKSALFAQQNQPFHKSMGLQITHERISIFNEQQQAKCEVAITDLYDENKEACGTKVEVKLKAI